MNALHVHQVINAITATMSALTVRERISREKISRTRAGAAVAAVAVHRSGSFTKARTMNATAAGRRPNINTYRHDIEGSWMNQFPATLEFTKSARNRPSGALV